MLCKNAVQIYNFIFIFDCQEGKIVYSRVIFSKKRFCPNDVP